MQIVPRLIRFAVCVGILVCGASQTLAEEPYERFLQKLKDEQLFDLALVYLNGLESQAGIAPEFKADIELERGVLLYQSAAVLSATNPQRKVSLDAAEQSLRNFLERKKNHPRRGEARLKLGELLLTRAEEAKASKENDPSKDNEAAIAFYEDAHRLFESTIQELAGILEQIKGALTDPNDKAKVAYRQKVQRDLRQAQLFSAKAVEDRGRSRADGSAAQKADLESALKMFSELYSKERDMQAIRNYALFYRSKIQATLGKPDDAIDGFQRIADLENVDVLRPLQTAAIAELVQLLAGQGKYPVAVDRADKWIAALRPDERKSAETMDLQLQLATAKLAWADQLEERDPDDRVAGRLVRDTRSDLRSMMRVAGAHVEKTRDLLASLGVDTAAPPTTELPEVKNFAEALTEARQRIDRSETDALGLAVMREQGNTADAENLQETIDATQQQALALLREALRLFSVDDDRDELYDARYLQAYLKIKQQQPWDAMASAEFLARTNPGTEKGLRAAAITLGALSDLLRTAGDDTKAQLTSHLEPFAEFLVQTWPTSSEAAAAGSALVQLALINKEWDKAEKYLSMVPANGAAVGALRRDAGIMFYARYREELKLAGDETESTRDLKNRAMSSLEIGTRELNADGLDSSSVAAINAYVRLLLGAQRVDDASKLMFDAATSPIKAIEAKRDVVSAKVGMESYQVAIQLVISQLAEGKLVAKQAIEKTSQLIGKLQELATDAPSGQLAGIFVQLAQELKDQLAGVKDPQTRLRLSQALVVVAVEAAKSEAFNVQYWSADTVISMADELASDRNGREQAKQAYASAAEILQAILTKSESTPGWLDPAGLKIQIRLLLAKAYKGVGDFNAAINELGGILNSNAGLVDVQLEAARTYQAWGDASNSGFHKLAYLGGRPDPKTRENLIWGWGKIARIVEGKPDFEAPFYEARYELAKSRYKYGLGLKDAEKKNAEIARAERDITATASLYPSLGGATMKKKFDALLRIIQKALGKPADGLPLPK